MCFVHYPCDRLNYTAFTWRPLETSLRAKKASMDLIVPNNSVSCSLRDLSHLNNLINKESGLKEFSFIISLSVIAMLKLCVI